MGRTLSVTICALLLLMSYASAIQTSADEAPELVDTPVAEFTGGSQQQIGAFNGSIPLPEDLHTVTQTLDWGSCKQGGVLSTPEVQDFSDLWINLYRFFAIFFRGFVLVKHQRHFRGLFDEIILFFAFLGRGVVKCGLTHDLDITEIISQRIE